MIRTTRRAPKMEKYVKIKPVVMEGFPDAHNVFLQVTNQQFRVTPHGCETKKDAEWTRDMLCIALAKIVADHDPTEAPSPTTGRGSRALEREAEVRRETIEECAKAAEQFLTKWRVACHLVDSAGEYIRLLSLSQQPDKKG